MFFSWFFIPLCQLTPNTRIGGCWKVSPFTKSVHCIWIGWCKCFQHFLYPNLFFIASWFTCHAFVIKCCLSTKFSTFFIQEWFFVLIQLILWGSFWYSQLNRTAEQISNTAPSNTSDSTKVFNTRIHSVQISKDTRGSMLLLKW